MLFNLNYKILERGKLNEKYEKKEKNNTKQN